MVVDIIPYDHRILPPTPKKKQNPLNSLIFGKKHHNSAQGGSNRLSALGAVEELFEEGSAMLAERCLCNSFDVSIATPSLLRSIFVAFPAVNTILLL